MENEMYLETADVKTCPHDYVFEESCEVCRSVKYTKTFMPPNAADLILGKPK